LCYHVAGCFLTCGLFFPRCIKTGLQPVFQESFVSKDLRITTSAFTMSTSPSSTAPKAEGPTPPVVPATNPVSGPVASPGQAPPTAPGTPGGAPGHGAPSGGAPAGGPSAGGSHGPVDPKKINPYIYIPSFTMAIVGCFMFLLASVIHFVQMFKYKTWYFNLMPQAALLSAAAMIARTNSIVNLKTTGATGPFVVYMFLDMIAPALVLFGNLFTFTRIMWWVTPNDKRTIGTIWGPPKAFSLTWGFAAALPDIAKTVGQKAFKQTDPTGIRVQAIAQIFQVFVVCALFATMLRFMMISKRWIIHGEAEEKNWRTLGWTATAVSGLLSFHHIFGEVAFDAHSDPKGFYATHEWMYWVTQEIPIFIIYILYSANYPGQYLPFSYCRFKFDAKKIEKEKLESSWPMQISNPIRDEEYAPRHDDFVRQDDKTVQITMEDLGTGRKYDQHK